MTSPEGANALIGKIFDGVIAKFDASEFAGIFEKDVSEHSYYSEPTAEEFIIRVLARETRPDRLVTAEIERVKKKASPWDIGMSALAMAMNPEWTEECPSSNELRLFGLWKSGVSGSVCGLI